MDYCITGGNGFIGTNLVDFLLKKEISLDIIDLNCRGGYNTICLDVCARLPKMSHKIMVHLASETNVRHSIEYPHHTIVRNISGMLNCLTHLKEGQIGKLIFTSSVSSSNSSSPYLASKKSCESLCKAYKDSYGLDIAVLRLSNVYGPYSLHKESVIHKFIKNCLRHERITIFGDGSQSRDFIYVDDVVKAIYNGQECFVGSGQLTSIKSIAEMISDISLQLIGYCPRVVYENAISGEVKTPIPRTDIYTHTKIDEGLVRTFEWFKENYVY